MGVPEGKVPFSFARENMICEPQFLQPRGVFWGKGRIKTFDNVVYTRQLLKAQMLKKGYTFVREVYSDGAVDAEYSGKIQGISARLLQQFDDKNQLVKTIIVFDKSYTSSMYKNWQDIKKSLENKYGAGLDLSTLNKYASKDYDSLLESDLNRGDQVFAAWKFPKYNYFIGLGLEQAYVNNKEYYVVLSYESPAWEKEIKRRQQEGDL